MHYPRFTYVSSTAVGPTLRVIMARICVTRNTTANTGERERDRHTDERIREGDEMPEGGRKKQKERKEEESLCYAMQR